MRTARDATLEMPVPILPSVQVNVRAGEKSLKKDDGASYLKLPSMRCESVPVLNLKKAEAMSEKQIVIHRTQEQDYRFQIAFGGEVPDLTGEEPSTLGAGKGPCLVQLLAAAVGSCLSDSLLFSLRKFKQNPVPLRCEVQADVAAILKGACGCFVSRPY